MELTFKEKCFLILVVWLLDAAAFCTIRQADNPREGGLSTPAALAAATATDDHRRLLKKHGLEGEVAVILHDVLGYYYIRNGQRYKFQ